MVPHQFPPVLCSAGMGPEERMALWGHRGGAWLCLRSQKVPRGCDRGLGLPGTHQGDKLEGVQVEGIARAKA